MVADPSRRCFLMGTSMGGAIALNVSLRVGVQCSGMVLLAPMCQIGAISLAFPSLSLISHCFLD